MEKGRGEKRRNHQTVLAYHLKGKGGKEKKKNCLKKARDIKEEKGG